MAPEEGSESRSFLRFIIIATLTVVGMALFLLSPWVIFTVSLSIGIRGAPLNYIALAAFWSYFLILLVFAAAVDWLRKKKSELS